MRPGTIVRCRNRDWVLLPAEREDIYLLRPLTGATDETVAVHRTLADLVGYELPTERVQPATFPLPTLADLSNAQDAQLLWQAARRTLREGASPFRSLGRISIRPRVTSWCRCSSCSWPCAWTRCARSSPMTWGWAKRSRPCSSPASCGTGARCGASACSAPPPSGWPPSPVGPGSTLSVDPTPPSGAATPCCCQQHP
jgi:hypothetical protein